MNKSWHCIKGTIKGCIEVNKLVTNKLDYQIMENINEKVDVISLVVA